MTQSTTDPNAVTTGVDTHKDTHAAVAINGLGARLGDRIIPTTPAGYQQLLEWAKTFGRVAAFGVEGTGSYGRGLTQFLRRQGLKVIEVSRPYPRNTLDLWLKREAATGNCRAITNYQQRSRHKITDWDRFRAFIEQHGGKTQGQLAALWGNGVTQQNISAAMQKLGISRKKLGRQSLLE